MEALLIIVALAITVAVMILLFMTNRLDKLQLKADRQFYYVKELFDCWISAADKTLPGAEAAGYIDSSWRSLRSGYEDAVYADEHIHCVNRLSGTYKSIPDDGLGSAAEELLELENELRVFQTVYNEIVCVYNRTLKKPLFRQYAGFRRKKNWETLDFNYSTAP